MQECEALDHDWLMTRCSVYVPPGHVSILSLLHHPHQYVLLLDLQDYGGDVALSTYMRLPIEQYFVLNPSQITFIGGSRFQLHVPRINVSSGTQSHRTIGILQ
jgi:hypothetical protein